MSDTSSLLHGFAADDPLLWPAPGCPGTPISAARFLGAARRFASTLPPSTHAINRCEDPGRFMLASAAAIIAGRTLVLPHTRADAVSRMLEASYAKAFVLIDDEVASGSVRVPDPFDDAASPMWPPPNVPIDHEAVVLHTSGSTGTPTIHAKTWRSLVRGARTFLDAFGPLPRDAVILGTVAAQHMFGLETTLLAPWQCGVPLACVRPLYPADLRAMADALSAEGRSVWLVTTPLHLRTFHAALDSPPPIRRIIVSTMPMPVELARIVERDWRVSVDEIYGCTEGGMLARRRPAHDERFVPGRGLAIDIDREGNAIARGGQLDSKLALGDRLARLDAGDARFTLVGRSGDLVKIAGKRTTLAELNAALLSIPGVRDAAFVVLEEGARVAALVVAPAHDTRTLRYALARRIDSAFLPRPILFVRALPRDPQGKVSLAALRRCLDDARVSSNSRPDRTLGASFVVPLDHPCLPGHFPGRPLVPGVLLLERVERVLREHGIAIAALPDARFTQPVTPGTEVSIRIDLVDGKQARFRIDVANAAAASGNIQWRFAS